MLLIPLTGMAFDSHGEPTWYDYRDTSWNPTLNKRNHQVEISTPEQLAQLSWLINEDNARVYCSFLLTADINLNKTVNGKRVNWVPIGYREEGAFIGMFFGYKTAEDNSKITGSHTISGLYIHDEAGFGFNHYGLFGNVKGVIAYLNLEKPDIYVRDKQGINSGSEKWRTMGSVCGTCEYEDLWYSTNNSSHTFHPGIYNVSVNKTHLHVVAVNQWMVGGIVGQGSEVGHCTVTGSIYSNVQRVAIGGVAGHLCENEIKTVYSGFTSNISDCLSKATITTRIYGNDVDQERCYMGGICGSASSYKDNSGKGANITSCASMGEVNSVHPGIIGGICGKMFAKSKISGCSSTCTLIGGKTMGGIAGAMSKTFYKEELTSDPGNSDTGPIVEKCAYSGHIDASEADYAGGICGYFDYEQTEALTACLFAGTMTKPKDLKHCSATTGYSKNALSYVSMCYYDKSLFDGTSVPGSDKNTTVKGLYTQQLTTGNQNDVAFLPVGSSDAGFTLNEGRYPMPYNNFVLISAIKESEYSHGSTTPWLDLVFYTGHGNMVYQPGAWLCSLPVVLKRGDCASEFVSSATLPEKQTDMQLGDWKLYLKNSYSYPDVSCVEVADNVVTACGVGQFTVTIGCTATTGEDYAWDRPIPFGGTKQLLFDVAYGKIWDGKTATGLTVGSGSSEDPYIIRNGAQLAYALKNNKQGEYYEQICDIYLNKDLTDSDGKLVTKGKHRWENGSWNGFYDGSGHFISGLLLGIKNTSLFGDVSEKAEIYNLGITNSWMETGEMSMLARNVDGKIYNCIVQGAIDVLYTLKTYICESKAGGLCYSIGKNNPDAVIEDCIVALPCARTASYDYSPFVNLNADNHGVIRNCLSVAPVFYLDRNMKTEGYSADGHSFVQNCYWLKGYENNDSGWTLGDIGNALGKRERWTWTKNYYPTLKTFEELDIAKLLSIPIRTDVDYELDGKKNRMFELVHQVEFEPGSATWEFLNTANFFDIDSDMGIILPLKEGIENYIAANIGILRGVERLKGKLGNASIIIPLASASENVSKGITFIDPNARQACVEAFDNDGDGYISLSELKQVTNEKTLTAFQTETARKMKKFPEFRFFKSITELTTQLNGLSELEEIKLPYATTTLGSEVFKGCDKLKTVTISSNLTTVKPGAFYGSSVDTIKVDPFNEIFEQRDGVLFSTTDELVAYPNGRSGEDAVVHGVIRSIAEGAVYKVPGVRRFYFETDDFNTVARLQNNGLVTDDGSMMDVYISDATEEGVLYNKYLANSSWKSYASADKLHIYFPLKVDGSVTTMVDGVKKYVGDFYIGFDTELPKSLTPYTVAKADTTSNMAYLYERNRLVPSMTAVLVLADAPGFYRLSPYDVELGQWPLSENKLVGVNRNGMRLGQKHSAQGNILTPDMNEEGKFAFLYCRESSIAPYHCYLTFNTIGASAETARNTYYDVAMALEDEGTANDNDFTFRILHNVVTNKYQATLTGYTGNKRNIVVPGELEANGQSVSVKKMAAGVFANNELCNIDMSQCDKLESIVVNRKAEDNPFWGTDDRTFIYLPEGMNHIAAKGQQNVVIDYDCKNLVISKDWDFVPPYEFHAQNVSYNRTICAVDNGDGTWRRRAYAICLPFEYDFTEQADYDFNKQSIYMLDFVSDNYQFIFDDRGHTLRKGEPYLLVVNRGELKISAEDVDVSAEPTEGNPVYNWERTSEEVGQWRGNFRRISSAEAEPMWAYGLQSDGKWKRYRTDYEGYEKSWIGAGLAYCSFYKRPGKNVFTTRYGGFHGGENGGFLNDFPADLYEGYSNIPDDEVTGITPVIRTVDADGTSRYFDLQGRLLKDKPQNGIFINNSKKTIIK